MKRILLPGLCVAAVALAGCSTSSHGPGEPSSPASMGAMGPVVRAGSDGAYFFGAGDELGQQIFTVYVASLQGDLHYATGENDFPSE